MRPALAVILVAYLALALAYNAATPFGAPPDERPHAFYVQHLVEQRALPVLRREARDQYEAHQPPLYYLLAAPVWAAARRLPEGTRGSCLRLVSTLLGGVGLLLIAGLAAATRPGDTTLAMGAVAFAAFLPMRLATAAAVGNDLLAEAVFTATLLLLARSIREGITLRRALGVGLLLGAGLLSKSTCLLLFPVVPLGWALRLRTREEDVGKPTADGELHPVAAMALSLAVALLVGGWWLVRNQRLYGEVLVAETFVRYFQDTARPEIFLRQGYSFLDYLLFLVIPLTFRSFWGVFGHMQIYMGAPPKPAFMPPSWVYPLLMLPTAAALVGLVRAYLRRGELNTTERALWSLQVVTWLLVVSAFLRFNTEFFQAQGRYLFPAMGPIVLLFTFGLLSLAPGKRRAVAAVWALTLAALALYALVGCILPAFRP
jgi:4-amino-4-deoxy-L-arabinose transferase-like glycosyltransferase